MDLIVRKVSNYLAQNVFVDRVEVSEEEYLSNLTGNSRQSQQFSRASNTFIERPSRRDCVCAPGGVE